MRTLTRNIFMLGLGCLAGGIHAHYCDWRGQAFPKRRAIFGLDESPAVTIRNLFSEEDEPAANRGGHPQARQAGIIPALPGGVRQARTEYAWGIAAAQDVDVKTAAVLGVLLPLGLLFLVFDAWIGKPQFRPAPKRRACRLSAGHWAIN